MDTIDLDPYLTWFTARHQRKHGTAPATSTLRTKRCYLSSTARLLGCDDEVSFAATLSDRAKVDYCLDMLTARLQPVALRAAFYSLSSFSDYALAKGLITHSELRKEDLPGAGPPKAIVVYSPEEVEEFLTAAKYHSLRWWAFLSFLAETGRRAGETLSLRWEWLRMDGEVPYFELPTTKNSDPQYIPLTSKLRNEVFTPENIERLKTEQRSGHRQWHLPQAEYPFPWAYTTAHLIFKRFCERHNLPNRGFHNFRHTYATEKIGAGVPIQAVAALLGHRTAAVTMKRYNHASALAYLRFVE